MNPDELQLILDWAHYTRSGEWNVESMQYHVKLDRDFHVEWNSSESTFIITEKNIICKIGSKFHNFQSGMRF